MEVTLLWVLSVTLIAVGLAGSVLPVLPGAVLGAWMDDFSGLRVTKVMGFFMGLVGVFVAALLL